MNNEFAPYTEFEEHTITLPKKRCTKKNIILCLVSSMFIYIIILSIILYPVINNTMVFLKRGNETINDLNKLIPEVRKAMTILESICKNKLVKYYLSLKC